jgi:probable signal peptide protein
MQKPTNDNCVKCKDDRKNKPLIGLEIIRGLEKDGDEFTGGTITDPKNGKTYKCTITRDGNKLNVRGYIGFSVIGRTQVWQKN